jgi:hypothetical protein
MYGVSGNWQLATSFWHLASGFWQELSLDSWQETGFWHLASGKNYH